MHGRRHPTRSEASTPRKGRPILSLAFEASRWTQALGWAAGTALASFREKAPVAPRLDPSAAAPSDSPILIFGAPRSGTSWLGKIFDSHPDTLYRHEPDAVLEDEGLPWICPEDATPGLAPMAASYLRRMGRISTLKTVGPGPSFAKSYRGALGRRLRDGTAHALRVLAATGLDRRWLDRIGVPDLLAGDPRAIRLVVKSVSSHGRIAALAAGAPDARLVLILRDPWGQVASVLRGTARGKFLSPLELAWIAGTTEGRRHGLTTAGLGALPPVEQLTWNWVVCNERMLADLAQASAARVIRYDTLCAAPMAQARALFDFAGLAWQPQTASFIARSTTHRGPARYYQVFRDARAAAESWRREMPRDDQARIAAILRRSALASICPDLRD